LTKVVVKSGESLAHALERFNKLNHKQQRSVYHRRRAQRYEKPSECRRRLERKRRSRAKERANAFQLLKLE
jgi:ribosomal protein S21